MINKDKKRAAASARPLCSIVIIQCTEQEHQVRSEEHSPSAWTFRSIRFGKVEAEDSHDGFCVDYVSSGYQIEIKIEFGNVVDERFYFVDRIKRNLYCFHVCNPPCYLVNIIYYPHLTALSYRLEGKKSMRKHTKIKWNLRDF